MLLLYRRFIGAILSLLMWTGFVVLVLAKGSWVDMLSRFKFSEGFLDVAALVTIQSAFALILFLTHRQSILVPHIFLLFSLLALLLASAKIVVVAIAEAQTEVDPWMLSICVLSSFTFVVNAVSVYYTHVQPERTSEGVSEPLLLHPSHTWTKYRATKKAIAIMTLHRHFASLPPHAARYAPPYAQPAIRVTSASIDPSAYPAFPSPPSTPPRSGTRPASDYMALESPLARRFTLRFPTPPSTPARGVSFSVPNDLPQQMRDQLGHIPGRFHAPLIHSARVLLTLGASAIAPTDSQLPFPMPLSESAGWQTVSVTDGVPLQRRSAPEIPREVTDSLASIEELAKVKGRGKARRGGTLWRETCVVAAEPILVVDLLKDVSRRPDWDATCMEEMMLHPYSPSTDVTLAFLNPLSFLLPSHFICSVRTHFTIPSSSSDLPLPSPMKPALWERIQQSRDPEADLGDTHVIVIASVAAPKVSRACGSAGHLWVGGYIVSPFSHVANTPYPTMSSECPGERQPPARSASLVTRMIHMSYGGQVPSSLGDYLVIQKTSCLSLLRRIIYRDIRNTPLDLPSSPFPNVRSPWSDSEQSISNYTVDESGWSIIPEGDEDAPRPSSEREDRWLRVEKKLRDSGVGIKELHAIAKFNDDPLSGIEECIRVRLCSERPQSIAKFLLTSPGLEHAAVGNFLASNSPISTQILREYSSLIQLKNLFFDEALRVYLKGFALPREAQMIDRVMEAFAARYIACAGEENPVKTGDAAHILAFSVIMLNTDLHNKALRAQRIQHMTVEQFIRNNRGINNGQNLPEAFLAELYDRVQRQELRWSGEGSRGRGQLVAMIVDPTMQGWLVKEGGRIKTRHRRWCVLKDGQMFYYRQPADNHYQGVISLENVNVREAPGRGRFCFELFPVAGAGVKSNKIGREGLVVSGEHDMFVFETTDDKTMRQWIIKIRASIVQTPLVSRFASGKDSHRESVLVTEDGSTKAR